MRLRLVVVTKLSVQTWDSSTHKAKQMISGLYNKKWTGEIKDKEKTHLFFQCYPNCSLSFSVKEDSYQQTTPISLHLESPPTILAGMFNPWPTSSLQLHNHSPKTPHPLASATHDSNCHTMWYKQTYLFYIWRYKAYGIHYAVKYEFCARKTTQSFHEHCSLRRNYVAIL